MAGMVTSPFQATAAGGSPDPTRKPLAARVSVLLVRQGLLRSEATGSWALLSWDQADSNAAAAPGLLSARKSRQRAASSSSPIAAAALASMCRARRKPWFGSGSPGLG